MEKLRVAKKGKYTIEVNDNGDTISFNLQDPTLLLRMEKAHEDVNKIQATFDSAMNSNDDIEGSLLTGEQRKSYIAIDGLFKDMRKAMDGFLGEGACQKIFGDDNYLTMYDELFEQLTPHFEKMGLSTQNYLESIKDKYGKNEDEDILEA